MSKSIVCILFALTLTASVAGQPQVIISGDSLVVTPARPTTADAIRFDIIIPNWDCCTRYSYDSLAPVGSDTMVMLGYTVIPPQACTEIACINQDKVLSWIISPRKAGTYAVYEWVQIDCPLCASPGISAPIRLGQFTVTPSTAVLVRPVAALAADRNAPGITGYNARGEFLGSASHRQAPGVVFIKNQREKVEKASTRIVIEPAPSRMP
jgi:hypothetical protein